MTTKKTKPTDRPVLVTTLHRGVFFGYATPAAVLAWEKQPEKVTVRLRGMRNVVYWSSDCRGFVGLAANGPTKSCKIGPAADAAVRNVTAIVDVTGDAEKVWQAAPWA